MATMREKIEKVKNRMKTAALVSAITIASLGSATNASAQNNQDKKENKTDLNIEHSQSNANDVRTKKNIYQYFYANGTDSGIKIDNNDLANGLGAAGISPKTAQFDKFCEAYFLARDSEKRITFQNLSKVMEETLTPEQISAFCDGLVQAFEENKAENKKDNLQEKVSPDKQDGWKSFSNEKADIKYSIGEDGISLKGNLSMNVSNLLPPVYFQKNKRYKCGTSQSFDVSMVKQAETHEIKRVIMEYYVLSAEDASNPLVQKLSEKNRQEMETHGLKIDKKGNFYQKANQDKLMQNSLSQTR